MSQAALVLIRPSACGQRGAPSGKVAATSAVTIGFVKKEPADQESRSLGFNNMPFAARSSRTALRVAATGAFSPTAISNLVASSA